jgi:hypothetical protein
MAEPLVLTSIELSDAELDTVSGGVTLFDGQLSLGGGSGPTAFSATVTINRTTGTTDSTMTDNISFAEGRSGKYALVINGNSQLGQE